MRRAVAFLFAGLLLAGCSTVGNVFKKTGQILMDPDIPVGSADDQPTRIALSLYAADDVNPNPQIDADAATEAGPENEIALEDQGPFAVNLHSSTKGELLERLQDLLDHLLGETAVSAAVPLPAAAPAKPVQTANKARNRPPLPPSLSASRNDVPLPRGKAPLGTLDPGETWERGDIEPSHEVALGQYQRGAGLTLAPESTHRATRNATPIAFRVLQLKDDSVLENADPNLLHSNPKKALGSTYIAADDYHLVPGQFKFIDFQALDEETRYLAVVAAFHDPNARRGYDVIRLESRGHRYALLVTLQDTGVTITDERYRPTPAVRHAAVPKRTTP